MSQVQLFTGFERFWHWSQALLIFGLLLLLYADWRKTSLDDLLTLQIVAWVHLGAVFALLTFLVAHVYLASTMGQPWYSLLKSMFTGCEELEETK